MNTYSHRALLFSRNCHWSKYVRLPIRYQSILNWKSIDFSFRYLMSKAAAVHQLPLFVTSLENTRLVMSHKPQNPAAEWSRPIKGKVSFLPPPPPFFNNIALFYKISYFLYFMSLWCKVKIKENFIKLHNIVVVCVYLFKTKQKLTYEVQSLPHISLSWLQSALGFHHEYTRIVYVGALWRVESAFPSCSGFQKPCFKR